jgi:hypothetical protein
LRGYLQNVASRLLKSKIIVIISNKNVLAMR